MKNFLLWLASFRLRILLRTAFLFLILAVVALAVAVLQGEKQRSYENYRAGFAKTKAQIVDRLRHPSGQLALLNPSRGQGRSGKLSPLLLPYSGIDFDDQAKARNAIEMADCLIRYDAAHSLCVAIGSNPWMGGFIYTAGTFASAPLTAHEIGDKFLDGAHRMRVTVDLRGQHFQWIAPFETLPPRRGSAFEGVRGRFTGYRELAERDYTGKMPDKEFRGWVWQEAACFEGAPAGTCPRRAFFSLRLPVEILIADLLARRSAPWPPPDLDDIHVRLQLLAPNRLEESAEGEEGRLIEGRVLFDSATPGAVFPFALRDLGKLLQPGETLRIRREDGRAPEALIRGEGGGDEPVSPLLTRLIRRLPVTWPVEEGGGGVAAPVVELEDEIVTLSGRFRLFLRGEADRVVDRALSVTATRLIWFVGAVMAIIALAWMVIEIGLVRRIARVTRRSRQLSASARQPEGFLTFDFSDLKGTDEVGILGNALNQLLGRVKEDASRERIRAAQEKEQWHAVGHEIMSPLQSLLALHGSPDDPDHRYLARMQQAVRVLYGAASPSEAFESSTLAVAALDLDEFLGNIAANAPHVGIEGVDYAALGHPVWVKADEYSLEDVLSHLLNNADRHRAPGTRIRLALDAGRHELRVHNTGPSIAEEWRDKIFEYGFSGTRGASDETRRGQGLFVAKTYMAKMGGTIRAMNEEDGVSFYLGFQEGDE